MPPPPVTRTFDLESGVRVTCDVDYLYANFSLPRPFCSRLRPNVRDRRQTASSLNAPTYGWGHNKKSITLEVEGARQRGRPRKTWKEVWTRI